MALTTYPKFLTTFAQTVRLLQLDISILQVTHIPSTVCDWFLMCWTVDNTIRDAILTCARKLTWVGLIFHTETTTKNVRPTHLFTALLISNCHIPTAALHAFIEYTRLFMWSHVIVYHRLSGLLVHISVLLWLQLIRLWPFVNGFALHVNWKL